MSVRIKQLYRSAGLKPPKGKGIHTVGFHKCVVKVTKKGGVKSPHAVCMAKLTPKRAIKKAHRRK